MYVNEIQKYFSYVHSIITISLRTYRNKNSRNQNTSRSNKIIVLRTYIQEQKFKKPKTQAAAIKLFTYVRTYNFILHKEKLEQRHGPSSGGRPEQTKTHITYN